MRAVTPCAHIIYRDAQSMDASGGGDRGDKLLTQFPVRIAGETTIQTQTRTGSGVVYGYIIYMMVIVVSVFGFWLLYIVSWLWLPTN